MLRPGRGIRGSAGLYTADCVLLVYLARYAPAHQRETAAATGRDSTKHQGQSGIVQIVQLGWSPTRRRLGPHLALCGCATWPLDVRHSRSVPVLGAQTGCGKADAENKEKIAPDWVFDVDVWYNSWRRSTASQPPTSGAANVPRVSFLLLLLNI